MLAEARSGRPDSPGSIEEFLSRLRASLDRLLTRFEIDRPASTAGEFWIDLVIGDFETNVSWKAGMGFGIYLSQDDSLGSRPDEVIAQPEAAAKRILQLVDAHREQRNPSMRLSDVRKMADTSQVQLASKLKVNQALISRLERQNDAKLSTIFDYIKALGGHAELVVRFDTFEAPITLKSDDSPSVGTRRKTKAYRLLKAAA